MAKIRRLRNTEKILTGKHGNFAAGFWEFFARKLQLELSLQTHTILHVGDKTQWKVKMTPLFHVLWHNGALIHVLWHSGALFHVLWHNGAFHGALSSQAWLYKEEEFSNFDHSIIP